MIHYGELTIYTTIPGMRYVPVMGGGYKAAFRRARCYFNDSCTFDTAKELAAKFRQMHPDAQIHCEWRAYAERI